MKKLDSAEKRVRKSPSENGQPPNAAKLSVSYALLGVTKLRRAYWTNGNCVKHAMKTDVSEARARAKPASSRCANTQPDARIFRSSQRRAFGLPEWFGSPDASQCRCGGL